MRSRGDLSLGDRPGFLVRRLHQIHLALFTEECGRFKVTPVQYSVLTALERHGPLDQVSLAMAVGIDRANATGVLSRLEARGLIQRDPDPGDRRIKRCTLTALGRNLTRRMANAVERCHRRTVAALPARERRNFLTSLERLVRANNALGRARLRLE
ncbi:MAG: MarR family transcriptional regulator [Rhodospirillales bacterium]|nr:MarR family transcriptional regulator [Rhodospirillales bacterium]